MLVHWLEVLRCSLVYEVHFCVKSPKCIMLLRHAIMKSSMFMRAYELGLNQTGHVSNNHIN
jgi:hypothetical protein